MLVSEAEALYGYIKEPIEGDKYKLRNDFNYRMYKIYNNLIVYYGEETEKRIYPEIYSDMCRTLMENIGRKCGYIILHASTVTATDWAIRGFDPFDEGYTLSRGNFNDIQKDMIRISMKNIIAGGGGSDEYFEQERKLAITQKYNLSRMQYYKELIKANKEMKRVLKEKRKEGLVLVK